MSGVYTFTVTTPDGLFSAVATPQHVLASGWTANVPELINLIHKELRPQASQLIELSTRGPLGVTDSSEIQVVTQALGAIEAFYDGDASLLAGVPVQQKSGPYRERAWAVLRQVEPGQPVTYAQYAERTGNPKAVRAAASACAMNAAALFVPCHRVLRTDGSLGGFRYGLEVKERLLSREGVQSATANA